MWRQMFWSHCSLCLATACSVGVGGDQDGIQQALDLGADGIIVPYVNNVEEARAAVSHAHYPTAGTRSVYFPQRSMNKKVRFHHPPRTGVAAAATICKAAAALRRCDVTMIAACDASSRLTFGWLPWLPLPWCCLRLVGLVGLRRSVQQECRRRPAGALPKRTDCYIAYSLTTIAARCTGGDR